MIEMQTQQILLPKKAYIGDTAELRCTFNSNSLELKNLVQAGPVELSSTGFMEELNLAIYDVKRLQLSPAGVDYYQLSVTFVPWKTGKITLPPYDIAANLTGDNGLNLQDHFIVKFDSIDIVSITQQNNLTGLRSSAAPLLLPGTTYKLYGFCILFTFILILAIRTITKRKEVIFYFKTRRLLRKYKKNRKNTEKQLGKILGEQLTDKDFSEKFQKIMRNYLEVRFEFPFSKTVTSEMMKGFYSAFGGTENFTSLISEAKEDAAAELVGAFIRTDFIRFSAEGAFGQNEKQQLIAGVKESIKALEDCNPTKTEEKSDVKAAAKTEKSHNAEKNIEEKSDIKAEKEENNV